MKFERRDFLRIGTAGFTGSLLGSRLLFSQDQDRDKDRQTKSGQFAELRSGTGSLFIKLSLDKAKTPGILELQMDVFEHGRDDTVIAQGTFTPTGGRPVKLYRSYFCVDDERQVFARLGDDDHWTSVVVSETGDKNVESLTVWNDDSEPNVVRIDKKKFRDGKGAQEYVLDNRGGSLNLAGARKPPEISAEDLENALDNNPDYLAFKRGRKIPHQHAAITTFDCLYIATAVPGGTLFILEWNDFF